MIKNRVVTPNYLQMEPTECGAVSLQIILAYYGCYRSGEELRELCGVSRDGTNADYIINAAEQFGLNGEGLFAELPEEVDKETNLLTLCEVPFPYIVFWELNHFLVLEGIIDDKIYLNDPALGQYAISYEEFIKKFSGIILTFTPSDTFKPSGKPYKPWRSLLRHLKPYKVQLTYTVMISAILILATLIFSGLNKIFIDYVFIKGYSEKLRPLLFSFFAVFFVQVGLTFLQKKALNYIQILLAIDQTKSFMSYLLKLPFTFFDKHFAGDLVYRLEACDRVATFLGIQTSTSLANMVGILIYSLIMIFLSPVLATVVICLAVIQLFVIYFSGKSITHGSKVYLKHRGLFLGKLVNGFELIETIKSQSLENGFFQELDNHHDQCLKLWQKLNKNLLFLRVLPDFFSFTSNIILLFLGVCLIVNVQFSAGNLVAFIFIAYAFQSPMQQLANSLLQLKYVEADICRIDDIMSYQFPSSAPSFVSVSDNKTHSLTVKNIVFGFYKLTEPYLEHISLTVRQGQKIALVGSIGSGKTTLLKCLTGLYETWEGQVMIDNVPLNKINDDERRKLIGVVSQKNSLFSGTVRDNLTLWDTSLPDEELIDACKIAEIYTELLSRGGLDANVVGEGTNFSEGEKQRLELARALVHKPCFLILDEGTSALDTITESLIMDKLKLLNHGLIIAAHRLSTIIDSDEIIVLDNGKIIERGTHAELFQKGTYYHHLISQEGV